MTAEGAKTRPLVPGDPERLGAYELTGRLGEGGQGVVYLGRDDHGRAAAVKLLHAQLSGNAAARTRFVRELEVAERVAGFCTAQVLDADIAGDRPYIISEYVPGPSLKERVDAAGPLDAEALMKLAIGTATALSAIHRAGIVHRDFKPPNVLMGPDGPRVIDFGVARALDSSSVTLTSQVVGTPAYMAPEQVAGTAVGPAADMFAWAGAMLYAATGRPPFGGDSIPAVMHRILHADPDLSALPPALAGPVAACLAKDPARRPSGDAVLTQLLGQVGAGGKTTGNELLAEASTLVAGTLPPFGPPPSGTYALPQPYPQPVQPVWSTQAPVLPPRRRKRRLPLILAGAVAVVTALSVTAFVLLSDRDDADTTASPVPGSVRLAFLGALSGTSESVGRPMYQGAKTAIDEYNATNPATRVELVEFDTQADPARAAVQARGVISGGAAGVIGPGFSGEAGAAAPLLEQAGIPMVSPGASDQSLSKKGWRFWHRVVPGADVATRSLADFMVREGRAEHVVVVTDEQAWSAANAQDMRAALAGNGVKVTTVNVVTATTDFEDTIEEIEEAAPDAIYYPGYYEISGRLIKQARQEGVRTRFYLTDQSLAAGFVGVAGSEQAEGTVMYCSCMDLALASGEPVRRLRELFAESFPGQDPGLYVAEGYDAAAALLAAVKAGHTTPEAVNGYLGTMNVPGVTQRLRFATTGDLSEPSTYLFKVTDGAIAMIGTSATASL